MRHTDGKKADTLAIKELDKDDIKNFEVAKAAKKGEKTTIARFKAK